MKNKLRVLLFVISNLLINDLTLCAQYCVSFLNDHDQILDFDFNEKGDGVFITNKLNVYTCRNDDELVTRIPKAKDLLGSNYASILDADVEFINDTVVFISGTAIGKLATELNITFYSYDAGKTWEFVNSYEALNLMSINSKLQAINFDLLNKRSAYFEKLNGTRVMDYFNYPGSNVYAFTIDKELPIAYYLTNKGDLFSYKFKEKPVHVLKVQTKENDLEYQKPVYFVKPGIMEIRDSIMYFVSHHRLYKTDLKSKKTTVVNQGCRKIDFENNDSFAAQLTDGTVWIKNENGLSNKKLNLGTYDIFTMTGNSFAVIRNNTLLELYDPSGKCFSQKVISEGDTAGMLQSYFKNLEKISSKNLVSYDNVLFEIRYGMLFPLKVFSEQITGLYVRNENETYISINNEPFIFDKSTAGIQPVPKTDSFKFDWSNLKEVRVAEIDRNAELIKMNTRKAVFTYHKSSNSIIQKQSILFPDSIDLTNITSSLKEFKFDNKFELKHEKPNYSLLSTISKKAGYFLDEDMSRESDLLEEISPYTDAVVANHGYDFRKVISNRPFEFDSKSFEITFDFSNGDELKIYNRVDWGIASYLPYIISFNGLAVESCDLEFLKKFEPLLLSDLKWTRTNDVLLYHLGAYEYLHSFDLHVSH